MRQLKRHRPRYPRIACSVPGCTRGTTMCEPGVSIICGKCWRRAPKDMRRWYTYWRGKANTLEKRCDPRADTCHARAYSRWEQILRLLSEPADDGTAMPPLLREQLRKEGLLDG